jgi:predicted permease
MLPILSQNLRYAVRQLSAQPAFTLFATLSLAIGIGASVTLFSAVHTLLFAPLGGLGNPAQLVELSRDEHGHPVDTFSAPDFRDYTTRAKDVADVFAYRLETLNVTLASEPQRALGLSVSGNYFDALQVPAYRGRLFKTDDDRSSATPVAVATYAAWRKYLDGDVSAVGKTVSINGQSFTLIGIAAPTFSGTIAMLTPAFYVPLAQHGLLKPGDAGLLDRRTASWLTLGARLHAGTGTALAQQQLSAIASQLAVEYPRPGKSGEVGIDVVPLRGVPGEMRGGMMAFSSLLFALTSLVLLVACVNVASMLLARGEQRRHEIAMRYVLGAGRRRVIAQLLTESVLLSLAAGVAGVLLAAGCCRLLAHLDPPTPVPISLQIAIDGSALWFALGCTLVTALVFGLLPALRTSGHAPAAREALAGTRAGGRRSRLGGALVVAQIALTMVLLVGGGLFLRALQRAVAIDPGFEVKHVLSADFNLDPSGYATTKQADLQQRLLDQLRAAPGIEHAALAALVPLDLSRMEFGDFQVAGAPEGELSPFANLVSPGFFQTLAIHLQGRDFDIHDSSGAAEVCVVNDALAHQLAPDGDVLGRSFVYQSGKDRHTLTVVGITPNGKYASLGEGNEPFLFLPLAQWPHAETSLLVKTAQPADTFAQQLRTVTHVLDASLPTAQVRPLEDILALSLLPQRIAGMTSLALGVIGLLLAAVGLYGLIAMHVASRTREFGVRLALGASPTRIASEVVRRGARLSATGLACGTVLSLGGAVLVSGLLYGASIGDALAFVAAAASLGAVALLASYLPARRASRIAPLTALRHE